MLNSSTCKKGVGGGALAIEYMIFNFFLDLIKVECHDIISFAIKA